jgi:hypothetical protein
MEEAERTTFCGIEVPAEERTPLVDRLLRLMERRQAEIQGLRDEVARLKGLPPRPTIRPSTLNEPHPDPTHKKRRRGKRPGSAKRQKTGALIVHETIRFPRMSRGILGRGSAATCSINTTRTLSPSR